MPRPSLKKNPLLMFIQAELENNKAQNIVTLDVRTLTQSFDAMVVATGTSTRHTQSIASKLIEAAKSNGFRPYATEGEMFGEWILIDFSDVIVHIMLTAQRDHYHLERLWAVKKKSKTAPRTK